MAKPILGLRTTIYKVADIAAAKTWYADAFDTEPYFDEPFYVGFNIGGYELGLMPDDTPDDEKSTNVLSYWGVEDINAEFARFIRLGAQMNTAPANVGGEIKVATVLDPWNNAIGLIYNPDFVLP